jgi:hypothetical protein
VTQLLRYREGKDGRMYLFMLDQLLAQAKARSANTPAVSEARRMREELWESIQVNIARYGQQSSDARDAGAVQLVVWDGLNLDRHRWPLATHIMALQRTLGAGG